MRSARNQFVLLGLIGQALSWDDLIWLVAVTALWAGCLLLPRKPICAGPWVEGLALILGSAAGYFAGKALGKSTHFFIGYGLLLIQVCRLLRPLSRREQVFTILIAFFHLSVACTILFDHRFILILLASLWLIPRVFLELEDQQYAPAAVPPLRPSMGNYGLVAVMTVLFFLVFPRGFLAGAIPGAGGSSSGGSLQDMLDPTRSGALGPNQIVLQIEGEQLGYLRCFVLGNFDGSVWHMDQRHLIRRLPTNPSSNPAGLRARNVRVRNVRSLAGVLPADGAAIAVGGTFFRRAWLNSHNAIEIVETSRTPNNVYQYWSRPGPRVEPLPAHLHRYYLARPEPSERLRRWIDGLIEGAATQEEQARRLEVHLRDNFTYDLGAPVLNRIEPLEDFLFNQQRGHCERFASALALLLRMQDIPSRIVIGYAPGTRNRFSGWNNVRFRDAHAWTEAYFSGAGWVEMDSTPRATAPPQVAFWDFGGFFEAVDWIWYSNVVAIDSAAQLRFLGAAIERMHAFARGSERPAVWAAAALTLLAGAAVLWLRRSARPRAGRRSKRRRIIAENFYGRMLKGLAKKGIERPDELTPLEFLEGLRRRAPQVAPDAEFVTRAFCLARYGGGDISGEQLRQIDAALKRMEQGGKARRSMEDFSGT